MSDLTLEAFSIRRLAAARQTLREAADEITLALEYRHKDAPATAKHISEAIDHLNMVAEDFGYRLIEKGPAYE